MGDYTADTAHLSLLEHGVYTVLMDRYYLTEQPIPADQVYRLARARTEEERAAVDAVLRDFFVLEDGVWKQKRIDAEIADAQLLMEVSRTNGRKGGRRRTEEPRSNQEQAQQDQELAHTVRPEDANKEPGSNPAGSFQEPSDNPAGTQQEPSGQASQSLLVREKIKEEKSVPRNRGLNPRTARKTSIPAGFAASDRVIAWYADKGYRESIAGHLESFVAKVEAHGYRYADWDRALMNAITDDWAKLRQARSPPFESSADRRAKVMAELTGRSNKVIDVTPRTVDQPDFRQAGGDFRVAAG